MFVYEIHVGFIQIFYVFTIILTPKERQKHPFVIPIGQDVSFTSGKKGAKILLIKQDTDMIYIICFSAEGGDPDC